MTEANRTEEQKLPDRIWVGKADQNSLWALAEKPFALVGVEYMRVLSRQEVERLLNSEEGCDTQQLLNSLYRQIEGQRLHIARLEAEKKAHRCHHALDEALNSGDGSYRP